MNVCTVFEYIIGFASIFQLMYSEEKTVIINVQTL